MKGENSSSHHDTVALYSRMAGLTLILYQINGDNHNGIKAHDLTLNSLTERPTVRKAICYVSLQS